MDELEEIIRRIEENMEKEELEKLNARSQEDKNLPLGERVQQLMEFFEKYDNMEIISL